MATSYAKHGFNDLAYARVRDTLSASTTVLRMGAWYIYQFNKGWASDREMYITLTDVANNIEICKVTGILGSRMTIERGQEGTVARAWPIGTLITQRSTAEVLGRIDQKGEFRTIAYNPNGVLAANYPNEKVYQSGDDCHRRWWIHADSNKWRLAAGTICEGESYDDGWIYELQKIYVFGGHTDLNSASLYNVGENGWTSILDLPADKSGASSTPASSGITMLFGGGADDWDSTRDTYEYSYNAYVVQTDMPSPDRSYCRAVNGDEGYCNVFGGKTLGGGAGPYNDNDQFYQPTGAWTAKSPTPGTAKMTAMAGKVQGGDAYYCAGDTSMLAGTPTDDLDEYSFSLDSWLGRTPISPVRAEGAEACDEYYFYTLGGRSDPLMTVDYFDQFNPATNSWTALTDYSFSPYLAAGAGLDYSQGMYFMGGYVDWTLSENFQWFYGWTAKADALSAHRSHTMSAM